jgi:outer membrane protein insertion porin family
VKLWIAIVISLVAAPAARAQSMGEDEPALADGDPTFGPQISIEAIEIRGNESTATRVIRRALPVATGDVLRAGDARLRRARYQVLALGFFRDVHLSMRKGSSRGRVVLVVTVEERGTIVLNQLYVGSSTATPWWAGADVSDRNALGTGVAFGAALVGAGQPKVPGAEGQWAGQLRAGVNGLAGTRLAAHGAIARIAASEPFRIRGAASDGDPANFAAITYRRSAARAALGYDLTPLAHLSLASRVEWIDVAPLAMAPQRVRPDGTIEAVELGLEPGKSRLASLAVGFDVDTRPDPVLPNRGSRVQVRGELASPALGSDYRYFAALGRYERWFPVAGATNVVSVHLTAGAIFGEAPLFDRFYRGDLNRLLTPRALGLVLTTRPPLDLLDTGADDHVYGNLAGAIEVQYARRWFRRRAPIYGGDWFVAIATTGLGQRAAVADGSSLYRAMPLDVAVDLGLRLDTEIGIFELALGNGLGRVPL